MKYLKKISTKISLAVLLLLSMVATARAVGTLEPQGEAGDDTHKSLKDVFNKLTLFTNNPTGINPSPFVTPIIIESTFPTLTEIFDLLVAEDDDLVPENFAEGVTVFGIEGTLAQCLPSVGLRTEWSEQPYDPNTWDALTFDHAGALSHCENLEEGGNTDWDLPTIPELYNAYISENLEYWDFDEYWSSDVVLGGSGGFNYYTIEPMSGGRFGSALETNDWLTFTCVR